MGGNSGESWPSSLLFPDHLRAPAHRWGFSFVLSAEEAPLHQAQRLSRGVAGSARPIAPRASRPGRPEARL